MDNSIILENRFMTLKISEKGKVTSLICKKSNTECLKQNEDISFCSATVNRPYNNEIKLVYPNKKTTYNANGVTRNGDKLIVSFECVHFKAVIKYEITDRYITFELHDFIVPDDAYEYLTMSPPPVKELCLLQLPVKNRKYFGDWLNVSWDEKACINVLAVSEFVKADFEERKGYKILSASVCSDYGLKHLKCALICTEEAEFLNTVDRFERDFKLPLGVESRRSNHINRSSYWCFDLTPNNVNKHIEIAKKFGFTQMLIYFTSFIKHEGYSYIGDYDYNSDYEKGEKDLKKVLDTIKKAGLTPGLHVLHSHIGLKSRYVTPKCDSRLNLTGKFTLSRPLDHESKTIYVEQNPQGSVMHPKCRVLKFGTELISYESYSETPPYRFENCQRGYFGTDICNHEKGLIGGILDITEFGATSCYIDERTSLQDEIADKIANIYKLGFEFMYFDGSEGTNPPFEIEVPHAQYRVYKKLFPAPNYCEGAAKAHFNWHFLSGANAFDVFPTKIFKAMINKFPYEAAIRMKQNFSRVNFGWWRFYPDIQPDTYEYGMSRALGFDCPITMQSDLQNYDKNPRTADVMEVMSRWEKARCENLLTPNQKKMLRCKDKEHILLENGKGQLELREYKEIKTGNERISAFIFQRRGKNYVVYWDKNGSSEIILDAPFDFVLEKHLDTEKVRIKRMDNTCILPADSRLYLGTKAEKEVIMEAFANLKIK